jgi:hypothetical protein
VGCNPFPYVHSLSGLIGTSGSSLSCLRRHSIRSHFPDNQFHQSIIYFSTFDFYSLTLFRHTGTCTSNISAMHSRYTVFLTPRAFTFAPPPPRLFLCPPCRCGLCCVHHQTRLRWLERYGSTVKRNAKRVGDKIDQELKNESNAVKKRNNYVTVLLLGQNESGEHV